MKCEQARPLVPLYLDGELTDAQSSALRPHLLGCAECRGAAQAEQALHAWFTPGEAVPVPEGFAARVARRALAGDRGSEPQPKWGARAEPAPIMQFVLQAVAVAAVLLMVLSIAVRMAELPATEELRAQEGATLATSLEALERLNREEQRSEAKPLERGKDR